MAKHQKHTRLSRPRGGKYHPQEWTLIGAPCSVIAECVAQISKALRGRLSLGYIDADHQSSESQSALAAQITDQIDQRLLMTNQAADPWHVRPMLSHLDAVLVNGNHFAGAAQIVFMDPKKKESLQRKLDRITDLRYVVVENNEDDIHDYFFKILERFPEAQMIKRCEMEKLASLIYADYQSRVAPLYGLVLTGGRSERMGTDKAQLVYHQKDQASHVFEQCQQFCKRVFYSHAGSDHRENGIADSFLGLGPMGGILSAFREYPDSAWLVVSCDLPLLDEETIDLLVRARDPSKFATAFMNTDTGFAEPLVTIWEPRSYSRILQFVSAGYSCPRKVLINSDIEQVHLADQSKIFNANTPEDMAFAKTKLSAKGRNS